MRLPLAPWIYLFLLTLLSPGPLASAEAQAANKDGKDTLIMKDGRLFDGVQLKLQADKLVVSFSHGNVDVPLDKVHDYILAEGAPLENASEADLELMAQGKVRYKGKWMSSGARDKKLKRDLEANRAKIEAAKERRLWRNRAQPKTKNFNFESTTPDHVLEYYTDLCEAYFQSFAKTWKIRRGKIGKLNLKFYVNQENYMQVTGMSRNVLGFFRFIEPYELNIYYDRLDPRATEEVLFHELGHYLQKLIDIDFKYPHWPGESLSEYYGASTWDPDKKKVNVGLILPARVQEVLYDIASGEWVTLKTLLTGAPDRTYHDYTWGWSLVHFLMTDKRHSKNFTKFYIALAKAKDIKRTSLNYGKSTLRGITGESMEKAFRKYMKIRSDDDFEAMQSDWYSHIEENLKITSSRGLANAAQKNLVRGLPLRAKRMFQEAISQGSEDALTFFRYGELLSREGERSEARDNYRLAIEHDGLVPEFYITLAESLMGLGKQDAFDEAENLLQLALDIEPDNFYLERNLRGIITNGRRKVKSRK